LNKWTLDKLILWIGTFVLLLLFLPFGFYLMFSVTRTAETNLSERGHSFTGILSGQIIDQLILGDRLSLNDILQKASSSDKNIRYICIVDKWGEVIAHTFRDEFPSILKEFLKGNDEQVLLFRTTNDHIMDVSAPIMSGQLGMIHVGLSRDQAFKATNHMILIIGISLACAFLTVFIGAQIVAAKVSKPLRLLESEVSKFPLKSLPGMCLDISGTYEVESLARGFNEMTKRLSSLEQERLFTQKRMIHTERLAALGELAAGLTHEIRNPLDGMLECVRYLDVDPDKSERQTRYLSMLKEGLLRIANIMQHMLTFARSGHETSIGVCKTSDIIDSLSLMLQGKMVVQKVKLTWLKPGTCSCMCNRQGLLQAILNLVLNAV